MLVLARHGHKRAERGYQYQFTLSGAVFEQAIVSDIPPVMGAQAVSVAVRWASFIEVPAARAQLVRPLKVIQTSQLNSCRFIVE